VLLLPPSVIGALFGMNFEHIPALQHPLGFWGALAMMIASSVLPYLWFRGKGWL
jgi:magnesium transporter